MTVRTKAALITAAVVMAFFGLMAMRHFCGPQAPAAAIRASEEKKTAPAPAEDPRNAEVRAKLQRKVSFEFVNTRLEEAVAFFRSFSGVKMTIAPEAAHVEKTPIYLHITDMNADVALQWTLKLCGLEYGIVDGAVVIAKPKPGSAPEPAAEANEPWVAELRQKLQRKVSFSFVDKPVEEALAFLNTHTKANIIFDPQALPEDGQITVNLRVHDMAGEMALEWILRLADLKYEFRNQALFVTQGGKEAQQKPVPGTAAEAPGQF